MSTDPRLVRRLWRWRTNVDALTIACIEHAEAIVRERWPASAHEFVITQGSYQAGAGDPNSAGTHDLGGVVDIRWCGHVNCILALRLAGMSATWRRNPSQGPWPDHIHAVVRDHPNQAASAHRQTLSVLAGRNGLVSNAPDDGPRPGEWPMPAWPWPVVKAPRKPVRPQSVKDSLAALRAARKDMRNKPKAKERIQSAIDAIKPIKKK